MIMLPRGMLIFHPRVMVRGPSPARARARANTRSMSMGLGCLSENSQPGLLMSRRNLRILRLFDGIPSEAVGLANSHRDSVGKAFYAGMYSHGVTGLRASVRKFPEKIRSFTTLVRAVDPKAMFASLVVLEESRLEPHRDKNNACCHNLAIPLTRFKGGELLLEDDSGDHCHAGGHDFRARAVSLDQGPIASNARDVRHSVGAVLC